MPERERIDLGPARRLEIERDGDRPARRSAGVLVIDDDGSIRGFLAEALIDEGYTVRTADDGKRALEVLGAWRPDLILLDLMMPEMDGWTFRAEQLARAEIADIPVIVLSAARDLESWAATLAPAGVFSKPFDLDALLAAIDDVASRE